MRRKAKRRGYREDVDQLIGPDSSGFS
jgi:hypothetical protein